jgi:hypothetical protein
MNLESGFFSIFASRDTHTATHYDRNYNFTIQLSGEKTWTVHREGPAIVAPSDNMAFDADRLASMLPHMHGATSREPGHRASIYQLAPGTSSTFRRGIGTRQNAPACLSRSTCRLSRGRG